MSSTSAGTPPGAAAAAAARTRPARGRTGTSAGPARTARCGPGEHAPAAARSGRSPRCGFEGKLHGGRLRTRCAFADRLADLLDDGTGRVRPELVPLAGSLLAMDNPLSGLTWLTRARAVQAL